jgi:hypothetical protein
VRNNQNSKFRLSVFVCLTIASLAVSSVAIAQCADPNTCYGTGALASNTTGIDNSGFGYQALFSNTSGNYNAANGVAALTSNTEGNYNTASGGYALSGNTNGISNTASGFSALQNNTIGSANSATGVAALYNNVTGNSNTASGFLALFGNTTGNYNTASGYEALYSNSTGNHNTAIGYSSLRNATGHRNVAVGLNAGFAIKSGRDNIMIGAQQRGKGNDNGVIRIGEIDYQTRTFIAGIRGKTTGLSDAVPVVIDSNGQLGTVSSSRRFKEDIQSMGSVSERLYALRPVTFRYRQPDEDGGQPLQFGLVAEEVAEVFPELVVYGSDGEPETVRYQLLATLLLNEFQRQHQATQEQATELARLKTQVAAMAKVMERLDHAQLVASR